jgi:hypothetical protein
MLPSVILNIALFQVAWFACVLGAARGSPGIGAAVAAVVVAWHILRAENAKRELILIVVALLLGALFETALMQTGWVRYHNGILMQGIAPYWMVALWAVFATTLNISLRSLRARRVLAAMLGALGGPAAYYAGARLGALEFIAVGSALGAIGIGWAILTPVLFEVARRFNGYART